jgi:hypothetical protein
MNTPRKITSTLLSSKIVVLLILPLALFVMGAKWAEKPVENLDTIVGKWKGSGITGSGYSFEVEYVFRKDGSFDAWAGGRGWSNKFEPPPGALRINGGKLEYRNEKGALRTGVLYEDAKGRRNLKFQGEDGGKWDVRPVKK